MSLFRQAALPLYRWVTRSQRAVLARQFAASRQWPAAILYYHRVANRGGNPWSISHQRFFQQIDFLDSIAEFASLDELRRDQRIKSRDMLKIAITFDDGYGENLERAIPELIRRSIPCTYFVSTDYVENNQPFPHDIQRGRPLRPNTVAELQSMAKAGIQIGGHTQSHLDLGQVWPIERLRRELSDSRKKLQDWTGQPIHYFAFPYGLINNISQAAIDMVAEAGYLAFVSAYGAWNFPNGEDFHLARFHGDPCMEALRNWLTLDPRRISGGRDLNYQKPIFTDQSHRELPVHASENSIPLHVCSPDATMPYQPLS